MQFSRFIVSTQDAHGGLILYNTLTGGLVTFTPTMGRRVNEAIMTHKPQLLARRARETFVEDGFLVSDPTMELNIIKTRNLLGRTQNELILSVMLTLDCNFRCRYCFQQRSRKHMSPSVERRFLSYIARDAPKKERISIDWYGGEPLLRYRQLVRMNDAVDAICRSHGTEYKVSVTTNGYLLNEEVTDYLSSFDVSHLQITLDGPAETHDRSRPTRTGQPTFERIVTNIARSVDRGVPVTIRINVWRPNVDRVGELYDILESNGLKNRVTILLKPVLSSATNPCEELCIGATEASPLILEVYRKAALKGWVVLPFVDLMQSHEFCIVDSVGQFIIDPSGKTYKCGEQFSPDEAVGKLADGGEMQLDEASWIPWIAKDPLGYPECRECNILPICMGGCSMKRFWRPSESCCVEFKHSLAKLLEVMVINEANRG